MFFPEFERFLDENTDLSMREDILPQVSFFFARRGFLCIFSICGPNHSHISLCPSEIQIEQVVKTTLLAAKARMESIDGVDDYRLGNHGSDPAHHDGRWITGVSPDLFLPRDRFWRVPAFVDE